MARFMTRLLAETKITHRFTEHDLHAKCASDAETLERAPNYWVMPTCESLNASIAESQRQFAGSSDERQELKCATHLAIAHPGPFGPIAKRSRVVSFAE